MQGHTMKKAPTASGVPNVSPTSTALRAAANSPSVVRMLDASVAGTRWNDADSAYSTGIVVMRPVYRMAPTGGHEARIGLKPPRSPCLHLLLHLNSHHLPNLRSRVGSPRKRPAPSHHHHQTAGGHQQRHAGQLLHRINSSSWRYPMPNPMDCAEDIRSPLVGSPAAPFNSIIPTPVTLTRAGIRFSKTKLKFGLVVLATMADKYSVQRASHARPTGSGTRQSHQLPQVIEGHPAAANEGPGRRLPRDVPPFGSIDRSRQQTQREARHGVQRCVDPRLTHV